MISFFLFSLTGAHSFIKIPITNKLIEAKAVELTMEKRENGGDIGGVVAANSPPPIIGSRDHHQQNGDGNAAMNKAEPIARLVPMVLCVAALVIMLKSSQTNDYGSLSYSDLGAFRYLVHANGICAGYSLLSAIIAARPRSPTMSQAWTFFFLDQVLTYLILAAGAVSMEVLYLAREGDAAITWSAACGTFSGFCHEAAASVIITFVAVACYAVLSLVSSYKLFSKYDAPVAYPAKNIEVAAFRG